MLTSRRNFVAASAAVVTTQGLTQAVQVPDILRLGLIGPGGMGGNHLRALVARKDLRVSWICEVDRDRLAQAAKVVGGAGPEPKTTRDMRNVFDDKEVDAVLIATPDHWHTPAAILALDAGKHVYVEKPCSHNIREGRLLVEAAKRSGKMLQVGTQSRSAPHLQEAIAKLKEGAIGEVLCAKAWNSQKRGSIGKTKPTAPRRTPDFEMWQGPAPRGPYRINMLPSIWRWWKAYGCGDIGNDGVHELDIALWGLGVTTHPDRIQGAGGKYFLMMINSSPTRCTAPMNGTRQAARSSAKCWCSSKGIGPLCSRRSRERQRLVWDEGDVDFGQGVGLDAVWRAKQKGP